MRSFLLLTLTLGVFAMTADRADAQLFGRRNLGSPVSRRSAGGGGGTNAVSGNERFVRGNRRRADFVGSDRRDQRRFVGSQIGQTSGRSRPVVSRQRGRNGAGRNLNPPYPAPKKNGPYEPRLEIGFEYGRSADEATVNSTLTSRLEMLDGLRRLGSISVSVEDQTATMRGEVVSERARSLAELVVLFEPGISNVNNELVVKPVAPPPPLPESELRKTHP